MTEGAKSAKISMRFAFWFGAAFFCRDSNFSPRVYLCVSAIFFCMAGCCVFRPTFVWWLMCSMCSTRTTFICSLHIFLFEYFLVRVIQSVHNVLNMRLNSLIKNHLKHIVYEVRGYSSYHTEFEIWISGFKT